MLNSNYKSHRQGEQLNKNPFYRFFRPLNADFSIRSSLYAGRDPSDSYRAKDGRFPTVNNDYADHENWFHN